MSKESQTLQISSAQAAEIVAIHDAKKAEQKEDAAVVALNLMGANAGNHAFIGPEPQLAPAYSPKSQSYCTEFCPPRPALVDKTYRWPGQVVLFHRTCRRPPEGFWRRLVDEESARTPHAAMAARFIDEAKGPEEAAQRFLGAVQAENDRKRAEIEQRERELELARQFLADSMKLEDSSKEALEAAQRKREGWVLESGYPEPALRDAAELLTRVPATPPPQPARAFTSGPGDTVVALRVGT